MDIKVIHEPFPHVIIDNLYTEGELKDIWQELDFLISKDKVTTTNNMGVAIDQMTNLPMANNTGLNLDDIYKEHRYISNILTHNRKVFSKDLMEIYSNLHPLVRDAKKINRDYTKIRYYDHNEEYLPHDDVARFTICTYFYRDQSKVSGGELEFVEFNYKVETKNNRAIFFTGCLKHAAHPANRIGDWKPYDGYGRYCMNQFCEVVSE